MFLFRQSYLRLDVRSQSIDALVAKILAGLDNFRCYEAKNKNESCYDQTDKHSAEVSASEVAAIAILGSKSVNKQADQAKYGDSVQNCAPEITPTGDRSVGLRQMLFDLSELLSLGDLLNFYISHIFSPFPLTKSECLHL